MGPEITLYRAVTAVELNEIMQWSEYRVPSTLVGKYFYWTREQAAQLCTAGWAVRVTSADFLQAVLGEAVELFLPAEGGALYLPGHLFPHGPVTVYPMPEERG